MVIYVMPTEEGKPPRALLAQDIVEVDGGMMAVGVAVQAVWSSDSGAWFVDGEPIDPEIGEAITNHAKELGVEW